MTRIVESQENGCRDLVRGRHGLILNNPMHSIESQIALTLDHIDSIRYQGKRIKYKIDSRRMSFESTMLNLEPVAGHYLTDHWFQRNRLVKQVRRHVAKLEQQFLIQAKESQQQITALQTKLLHLWDMWHQLSLEDEDGMEAVNG